MCPGKFYTFLHSLLQDEFSLKQRDPEHLCAKKELSSTQPRHTYARAGAGMDAAAWTRLMKGRR